MTRYSDEIAESAAGWALNEVVTRAVDARARVLCGMPPNTDEDDDFTRPTTAAYKAAWKFACRELFEQMKFTKVVEMEDGDQE